MRSFRAAAFGAILTAAFVPAALAQSFNDNKPISYSIDGGTATGYFKIVAEAINGLIREVYPGSDATYKPGSPAGGLVNIASGKSDIVFNGAAAEVGYAVDGKPPFKESLANKMSFVMKMHEGLVVHQIMLKDWADKHGIKTFDDIVAKRPPMKLAVNTQANLQSTVSMYIALFEAHGIAEADIAKPGSNIELFRGNTAEGLNQLRDGKVDAIINGAFLPTADIADIARGRPLAWMRATDAKIKAAADRWTNVQIKVPAGAYQFIDTDTSAIAQWNTAVVGNHVSEETVYKFMKALVDNQDRLRKIHPSLADFALDKAVVNPTRLPMHPGAVKFYRERGILK